MAPIATMVNMSNQVTLSHCPKLGRECIAYGVCWRPRPNPPPPPRPSPHLRFVVVVGVVVAVLAAGACPAGARALFPKRAMADDCKQAIPNMDDGKSSNERLSRRKTSPTRSQRSGTSLYLPAPAPARKPKLIIMIHSFQQTRTQNHQHQDRHLLTSTTTFSTVIATRSSGPGPLPSRCPVLACPALGLSPLSAPANQRGHSRE